VNPYFETVFVVRLPLSGLPRILSMGCGVETEPTLRRSASQANRVRRLCLGARQRVRKSRPLFPGTPSPNRDGHFVRSSAYTEVSQALTGPTAGRRDISRLLFDCVRETCRILFRDWDLFLTQKI